MLVSLLPIGATSIKEQQLEDALRKQQNETMQTEKKLREEIDAFKEQLQRAEAANQEQLEHAKAAHKNKLKTMQNTHEEMRKTLADEYTMELQSVNTGQEGLATRLKKVESTHKARQQELKAEHGRQLEKVKKEYVGELGNVKTESDNKQKEIQHKFDGIVNELSESDRIKGVLQSKVDTLQQELRFKDVHTRQISNDISSKDIELKKLQEEMERLRNLHRRQLLEQQNPYQDLLHRELNQIDERSPSIAEHQRRISIQNGRNGRNNTSNVRRSTRTSSSHKSRYTNMRRNNSSKSRGEYDINGHFIQGRVDWVKENAYQSGSR